LRPPRSAAAVSGAGGGTRGGGAGGKRESVPPEVQFKINSDRGQLAGFMPTQPEGWAQIVQRRMNARISNSDAR